MAHRYKKCSDNFKVTSGHRAEVENVKNNQPLDFQCHLRQQMLLYKSHCTFYIYGELDKKVFCQILKKMVYWLNYRPKCPEVADFCYFGIIPKP